MSIYGRSMVGMVHLDLRGKMTRGNGALIQDMYHLLITTRGTLPADPELGLGLLDMILSGIDESAVQGIGVDIESELAKDERVKSVRADVTVRDSDLDIDVTVEPNVGPAFTLVGPIGAVRVEVLGG